MKTTTVANVRAHLSALLRRVQRGETLLIVSRGRPIGRIEPVRPQGHEGDSERIVRLEKMGVLRPPADAANWRPILDASPVRASRGQSVRATLLEARSEGR